MQAIPESLRFYWPDGQPCFEVDSADGKKKLKPTIAHVRKLGLVPSVTTILKETLASPSLVRWRERNAAEAMFAVLQAQPGLKHEEIMHAWADKLEEGSAAVTDPGKAIHAAVEMYFRGEGGDQYADHIRTVVYALNKIPEEAFADNDFDAWKPEVCIPTHRGYGGRCDLYGGGVVVNLKTRDFSDPAKVRPYESEPMQLAAYAAALGATRIANLFLSRSDPAAYVLKVYTPEEQAEALANFDRLLAIFKSLRGLP